MRDAWAGPVEKGANAVRQGIEALPTLKFPEPVGYAFLGCYILLAMVTLGIALLRRRNPAHPLKWEV